MSFICKDIEQIKEYTDLDEEKLKLLDKNLPGPFTFILNASQKAPKHLISKQKTVGVRIPDNQICLKLTQKLGNPIITTSINLSGDKNMTDTQKIEIQFHDKIDLILDAGPLESSASTIVNLTKNKPKIIREGKGKLKK